MKCFIKGFAALWHDPDTLPMNNLWGKERGIEMAKKNKKLKRVLLAIFFCLLMSNTANAQSPRVLWERVQVMEVKDGALNENSQWKLIGDYSDIRTVHGSAKTGIRSKEERLCHLKGIQTEDGNLDNS